MLKASHSLNPGDYAFIKYFSVKNNCAVLPMTKMKEFYDDFTTCWMDIRKTHVLNSKGW